MIKFLSKLLDWLYPTRCYVCKKTSGSRLLCDMCFSQIKILPPTPIKSIKNVKIYSSTVYSDTVKKLIRAIKYHNKHELAQDLAQLMFKYWKEIEDQKDFYEIIPTPTYPSRLKKRKYDHIKLICDEFAKMNEYKVNTNLIKRIKDTKPQYKLTLKQREDNLKNAFEADKTSYNKDSVLLIDDICTTGTTLSEMIKTLHSVGIEDITVLCCSCNESYVRNF